MVRRIRSISRAIRESSRPTLKQALKKNEKVLKAVKKAKKILR